MCRPVCNADFCNSCGKYGAVDHKGNLLNKYAAGGDGDAANDDGNGLRVRASNHTKDEETGVANACRRPQCFKQ